MSLLHPDYKFYVVWDSPIVEGHDSEGFETEEEARAYFDECTTDDPKSKYVLVKVVEFKAYYKRTHKP